MLARALAKPSNLLVLDEPTNDLDLETLDVLEETLGDYAGTVILISHDRDFLDRVVNAVIVPEGDGAWNEYAGGYSDMLAQRGRRYFAEAPASRRRRKPAAKTAATSPPPAANGKKRLSFNEKFALENLPKQMAALEEQDHDPAGKARRSGIVRARPQGLRRNLGGAGGGATPNCTQAEEKWLELELLRADVEGA